MNTATTCCPECGTFPGQEHPNLVYNRSGDNYPCDVCRGTGIATHPHYLGLHHEPVMSASFDCPLCKTPLPLKPDAVEYEPPDISDIAF